MQCKLTSRQGDDHATIVQVGGITVGGPEVVVMAGPCAVESENQIVGLAELMKRLGAGILRGGAFKPRTSPYSFQGLAEDGLKMLASARKATGLPVVTEVMDTRDLDTVCRYADLIQIGSRNMQNFALLKEVGTYRKPVLLKRGLSATLDEWIMAAEYILAEGNDQVILCERGIRTFETFTRNTMDVSAIPAAKHLCHLPVIADPSHASGRWGLVAPLAKAAVAAGADGLIIEVHNDPANALCDGAQSLTPENFQALMGDLRLIARAVGREI